jgi:uncharacterized lipoprotein YehR (DUF1307 family)
MSYITVETELDLDDYSDEIIYYFKRDKIFREKLLKSIKDYDVMAVRNKNDDDDVIKQFTKIIDNYWKLTAEEEEVIRKMADRF